MKEIIFVRCPASLERILSFIQFTETLDFVFVHWEKQNAAIVGVFFFQSKNIASVIIFFHLDY